MHEYSIVSAVIEQVESIARQQRATRVTCVRLRIGELAGVDTGLLRTAWDLVCAGSRLGPAELAIESAPARWRCASCSLDLPRASRLVCEGCGTPARLVSGDELVLERIEMECESDDEARVAGAGGG